MITEERRKQVRRQSDRELLAKLHPPAGAEEPGDREKRHRRRRAIRHHCKVHIGLKVKHKPAGMDTWSISEHPVKGRILDLSETGCSVFTRQPMEMGQELNLVIGLESGAMIRTGGAVRWTKDVDQRDGFASGVQFERIEKTNLNLIKQFLKEMDATVGL